MQKMIRSRLNAGFLFGFAGCLFAGNTSADIMDNSFIKDSKATIGLRNFYMNQDQRHGGDATLDEWGQAFMFNFQSGYTPGVVGFGVDLYADYGVRLDGGSYSGKSGADRIASTSGSFPLESNGKYKHDFGRVGYTGKIRYSKTEAHVGTLRPKFAVIRANDARLLPELFWGYQLTSREIDNLTLVGGRIEHSTERNSSNSDSLSVQGSNSSRSTGAFSNSFFYAVAEYQFKDVLKGSTLDLLKNTTLTYNYGGLQDFYKQHFVGLINNLQLPVGVWQTDFRYYNSSSSGANSTASGRARGYHMAGRWAKGDKHQYEVDNRLWSLQFTYSVWGHAVKAGYQKITGHSDFPSIATDSGTGRSLYLITNTNIQGAKFSSAGERTWVAGYSYDFSHIGVPGLSISNTYYKGTHIADTVNGHKVNAEEWARDLTLAYQIQQGTFKGLGITWTNGTWRGDDSGTKDRDENRVAINYSLALF